MIIIVISINITNIAMIIIIRMKTIINVYNKYKNKKIWNYYYKKDE